MAEWNFPELIKTAHGCVMPDVATHCIEDAGELIHYDVYLLDWNIRIEVPMPEVAVIGHVFVLHPEVDEHTDLAPFLRGYKVRAVEAIAYALVTFEQQPHAVRQHLEMRFGPMLETARKLGRDWWNGTQVKV